jgi:hypothetical protein
VVAAPSRTRHEPRGHVSEAEFEDTLAVARVRGLDVIGSPAIRGSRTAVLAKR